MKKKTSDLIRAAILKSGLNQSELSRETGIPQQRISAFIAGKDIRLSTAGKLMDALGLEVTARNGKMENAVKKFRNGMKAELGLEVKPRKGER